MHVTYPDSIGLRELSIYAYGFTGSFEPAVFYQMMSIIVGKFIELSHS